MGSVQTVATYWADRWASPVSSLCPGVVRRIYPVAMEGASWARLLAARGGAIAGISGALWVALSLHSVPVLAASSGLTLTAAAVGTCGWW